MESPWRNAVVSSMGILIVAVCAVARADSSETLGVEALFKRSGEAYRSAPAFEIILGTSVEFPDAPPAKRSVRYLLGEDPDVAIEIGSVLQIAGTGNSLYVERIGSSDRYLETPYGGDLAKTLEAVRGQGILAGLWEPPQLALREGKSLGEVIDSFRFSNLLEELEIQSYEVFDDSTHQVHLQAANGRCTASFDPDSFYLTGVEYFLLPSGAPEGYIIEIRGRYETQALDSADDLIGFIAGDRAKVETYRDLSPSPPGIPRLPEKIFSADDLATLVLDIDELAAEVRDSRVLLIGEDHLYNEPPAYLVALLDRLDDRPLSLHLELPRDIQPLLDRYLREGDERTLSEIFDGRQVLQLQTILRWAHENRERILGVQAMDEPLYEILYRRAYAQDTRNQTMAMALHQAWQQHPTARIVAYAGQLHMMRSGRYRFDIPSREPAGSRLLQLGVPKDQVATILLNGDENFHLHAVWDEPGALPLEGEVAKIPVAFFIDYPIFRATHAGELFDYYVNLGPLTRVELK